MLEVLPVQRFNISGNLGEAAEASLYSSYFGGLVRQNMAGIIIQHLLLP